MHLLTDGTRANFSRKLSIIKQSLPPPEESLTFLGGDFNFTASGENSISNYSANDVHRDPSFAKTFDDLFW